MFETQDMVLVIGELYMRNRLLGQEISEKDAKISELEAKLAEHETEESPTGL